MFNSLQYQRIYREENREKRRKWNRDWIHANKDRYNASKYLYRERTKLEVLQHYCKGEIQCFYCGFKNIDALCLDHINNDGAKKRKEMKISGRGNPYGQNTYEAIKKFGYPDGLQVLCANCNMMKEMGLKKEKRLLNHFYKKRKLGGDVSGDV